MKNLMTRISILFLAIGLFSFSPSTIENGRGWEVLGKRTVNMKADHDEIRVTATEGRFNKVKFKITKAPIYVKNVKIVFGNGSSENHIINRAFKKGTLTRAINLKGRNRIIKKIVLNYKTINVGKGRAHVIALGKH